MNRKEIIEKVKCILELEKIEDIKLFWEQIEKTSKRMWIKERDLPNKLIEMIKDLKNNWHDPKIKEFYANEPKSFDDLWKLIKKSCYVPLIFNIWINIAPKEFFNQKNMIIAEKILKIRGIKPTTHMVQVCSVDIGIISEGLKVKPEEIPGKVREMLNQVRKKFPDYWKNGASKDWCMGDLPIVIENLKLNSKE